MSCTNPPSYRFPLTSSKWPLRKGFPHPSRTTYSPRSRPFTTTVACWAFGAGTPAATNNSRLINSFINVGSCTELFSEILEYPWNFCPLACFEKLSVNPGVSSYGRKLPAAPFRCAETFV